ARRAEAALHRVRADEGVDERMLAQALDRRHLPLDRVHEGDAREHGRPIDHDGAGAAMPLVARDLRSGEPDALPQHAREAHADRNVDDMLLAVHHQPHPVTARMSARWMSRDVVRATTRASPSSSASGSVRHRSRAARSSSRICARSPACPLLSYVALSASPSAPNESCCRMKRSGNAIDRYWWMRASGIGCASVPVPWGVVGSSGGSPSAIRFAWTPSIPATCSSLNPDARAVRSAMRSEFGCEPYG